MSTNLKPTSHMTGTIGLTRFCGPQVELGTRQCIQLTPFFALGGVDKSGYIQLTQDQALELAEALVQFARGLREEAE